MGHQVDVVAGPPKPDIDEGINLHMVEGLDLYNPENMKSMPPPNKLYDPINFMEWMINSTQGYPEPFIFGLRAYKYLKNKFNEYDIIHDNQSLSYGLLGMQKYVPTIATIHHPITRDRDIAINSVTSTLKKIRLMRWYSFINMQKRVSRKLPKIITVSECSKVDIKKDFMISEKKLHVVPNGINTELFYPIPEIKREENTLIVTNSADSPLKGLYYLLQAVHEISKTRPVRLTVIGKPRKNGGIEKLVKKLNISRFIHFTGRITNAEFVRYYAKASIAVVPSVYEGFGLPVGEAMACALPVICTTGGALPEVAGESALLVPPGNPEALKDAILHLFDHPEKAEQMGKAGFKRVIKQFSWEIAARETTEVYKEVIYGHNKF